MPDITAARPAAGAPVESAWGGQVHDALEGLQWGVINITFTGGTANGAGTVTYPRPYVSAPSFLVTMNVGSDIFVIRTSGPSTTACTISVSKKDGSNQGTTTTVPVSWLALGTPA